MKYIQEYLDSGGVYDDLSLEIKQRIEDEEDCKLGPDCKCEDCVEETINFNAKI